VRSGRGDKKNQQQPTDQKVGKGEEQSSSNGDHMTKLVAEREGVIRVGIEHDGGERPVFP
jgi:hypothetical protein